MYGGPSMGKAAPVLAMTGFALAGWLWAVVALFVLGGAFLLISRLGPRIAIESLKDDDSDRRHLALTVNGHERLRLTSRRR